MAHFNPSAARPCQPPTRCSYECPDLVPSPENALRCLACDHLAVFHEFAPAASNVPITPSPAVSTQTPAPTPDTTFTPSLISTQTALPAAISSDPPAGVRWPDFLSMARKALPSSSPVHSTPAYPSSLNASALIARKEVNGGFRSSSHLPTASASMAAASHSRSTSMSLAPQQGKGKAAAKRVPKQPANNTSLVKIDKVILVPWAYDYLSEEITNSGDTLFTVAACRAPPLAMEEALAEAGYVRYDKISDPLELDTSLDADDTAAYFASRFHEVWIDYCSFNDIPTSTPPPREFIIQLTKRWSTVKSVPNQVGATMQQLLKGGSTRGRRPATKKIYIAVPFPLKWTDPTPCKKGKRKALPQSDSEDESKDEGQDEADSEVEEAEDGEMEDANSEAENGKQGGSTKKPAVKRQKRNIVSARRVLPSRSTKCATISQVATSAPALVVASHLSNPDSPEGDAPTASSNIPLSPTLTEVDTEQAVAEASASFSATLHISDSPHSDDSIVAWIKEKERLEDQDTKHKFDFVYPKHSHSAVPNPFDDDYKLEP
ncbi:hypothetical protein FRC09_018722 [Ceratobasidium sp. 395]|nr:hypothetical protein FRC09_018722 [Ceratobasidium sp. 395]